MIRRSSVVAMAFLALASSVEAKVKIGVIGPFSGPFASQGKNFKAGIDAYMALNGSKVGAEEIEIIYRDLPQADPAQAKARARGTRGQGRRPVSRGLLFHA